MGLDHTAISDAYSRVLSHVKATGVFRHVAGHEISSAPPEALTAALWVAYLGPAPSGASATSALLVLNVRVYHPMRFQSRDQADAMEPRILVGASAVMGRLLGDLTLGGTVRSIDSRGMSGRRLEALSGYDNMDNKWVRFMSVTVPIIINDAWEEGA